MSNGTQELLRNWEEAFPLLEFRGPRSLRTGVEHERGDKKIAGMPYLEQGCALLQKQNTFSGEPVTLAACD